MKKIKKNAHTSKKKGILRLLNVWFLAILLLAGGLYGAYHVWDRFFVFQKPLSPSRVQERTPRIPTKLPFEKQASVFKAPVLENKANTGTASVTLAETTSVSLTVSSSKEVADLLALRDALLFNKPCFTPWENLRQTNILTLEDNTLTAPLCSIPGKAPLTNLLSLFQSQIEFFFKTRFTAPGTVPPALKKIIYAVIKIHPITPGSSGYILEQASTALNQLDLEKALALLETLPPQDKDFFQEVILTLRTYKTLTQNLTTTLISTLKKEGA